MLGRATAQMRCKSEVLPACSEHFNLTCGEGSRDDRGLKGNRDFYYYRLPFTKIHQECFFPFFTDVPKILLLTLILQTCPKHKILLLLLCYLLSCDNENINGSES